MYKYSFEFNLTQARLRLWQIIPGALSWTTLIGLTILSFILPFWVAIFIILYDIYILIRAVYMSVHLVQAYRRLRSLQSVDWLAKAKRITEPMTWQSVHHAIVIPTYDESVAVLHTTLTALTKVDFPLQQLHVVVGFEERVGEAAHKKSQLLKLRFGHHFGTFTTTFHPDGLPGEKRVKSANATWAIRHLEQELSQKNIAVEQILVSNLDSDTVVSPNYFSYLTYIFLRRPDRYRLSYQPLPMYHNNVWDAPAFSRVIATGSTFWQMIESTRPERLVTFSSHSMTLKALKDVGYWQRNIISEDSRIFWQCLLHYSGRYRTEPLYTTVSMDAALGRSWWRTLLNQYKQKRRWAWGIENFPYLMEGFIRNKQLPFRLKWTYILRTLEGHYTWATAPLIVAAIGWLPIFFGGPDFHVTIVSYNLPFITRTIMTVAMFGLIVSGILTYNLLPSRPERISNLRYLSFTWQWLLVPVIATFLSAVPALDAETRLMLGRDLNFNVMEKHRKKD